MVTDQELASCVESLLRQHQIPPSSSATITPLPDSADRAAATAATVAGVLRHLEAKLGLDLSHKAAFIQHYVDLLLHPPSNIDNKTQQLQTHVPTVTSSLLECSPSMTSAHDVSFRYAVPQVQQVQFQQQQHQPIKPATAAVTSPKPQPSVLKQSVPIKRRGGPGGLNKVCGVSPELQVIVGEPTMARTQIVKQLWAYIRKNNLQDPNNKRKIICNDQLRVVFETDCTDMFKMNKLLAKHIIPLEQTRDPISDLKRLKSVSEEVAPVAEPEPSYAPAPTLAPETEPAMEAAPAVGPAYAPAAAPRSETDVRQCPLIMSEALAKFFESEEKEMLQSEALRRVWDYIKDNNLEDPMDTMTIICDPKLQELLGCETFSTLAISGLLARHLRKQS